MQRAFTGVRVQRTLLGPSESLLKAKFAEIFTTFTAKIFVFLSQLTTEPLTIDP